MLMLKWTLGAALFLCACGYTSADQATGDPMDWLSGCWVHEGGATTEIWTESYGGLLFGYSVTMKEGVVAAFEDLRIEPRKGGSVLVASPNGTGRTEFAVSDQTESSVTFENSEHDFPQRLTYAGQGDRLTATISSLDRAKSFDFEMTRCGARKAI